MTQALVNGGMAGTIISGLVTMVIILDGVNDVNYVNYVFCCVVSAAHAH